MGIVLFLTAAIVNYIIKEIVGVPSSLLIYIPSMMILGRAVSSDYYKKHTKTSPVAIATLIVLPKFVIDILGFTSAGVISLMLLFTQIGILVFWLPLIAAWGGVIWQGHLASRKERESA